MPLPFRSGSRGRISLVAASAAVFAVVIGVLPRTDHSSGFAASLTPPPPPTYVPTPIGPPPSPPGTITTTPAGTTSATPGATPGVTSTPHAELGFSLDAARVSRVNNPGNLKGLAAVKPGSKVWLMMYYTVTNLPKNMTRLTSYTVEYRKKVVFKVAFKTKMTRSEVGRFSRYTVYAVPSSLPYGSYIYRAGLTIGKTTRTKSWSFQVAKHERVATGTH